MKKKKQEVSDSDQTDVSDNDVANSNNEMILNKNGLKPGEEDQSSDNDESSNDNNNEDPNMSTKKPNQEKSSVKKSNSSPKKSNKEKSKSVKANFWVEELTSDDELFTFQCPENYRKHLIENKDVEFSKLSEMISKKTSEIFHIDVFKSEKSFLSLALPSKKSDGCLINIPLKGHIVVNKDVSLSSLNYEGENTDKDEVSFPKDIKIRHPLLGVDWKEHIDLANQVLKKDSVGKKVKKRKKEREKLENSKVATQEDVLEYSPSKKKKKKHS